MDWNQHMRNAAFPGCAEETRMRYLDSRGWTMAGFEQRRTGPVVVEDRISYRREPCGTVDGVILWLDAAARRRVAPPAELVAPWEELACTEDFAALGEAGKGAA